MQISTWSRRQPCNHVKTSTNLKHTVEKRCPLVHDISILAICDVSNHCSQGTRTNNFTSLLKQPTCGSCQESYNHSKIPRRHDVIISQTCREYTWKIANARKPPLMSQTTSNKQFTCPIPQTPHRFCGDRNSIADVKRNLLDT